ncbi:hypothetical protein JHK85_004643 [Glycine max]|nr:hypothetical protein JHK85_004643 [Glycine max]
MRNVLQVLIGEADPQFVDFQKPCFTWPVTAPALNEEVLTSEAAELRNSSLPLSVHTLASDPRSVLRQNSLIPWIFERSRTLLATILTPLLNPFD